jgi:hypothetical protein
MRIQDFLALLRGVKQLGHGWSAHCPAHEDRNPSLSIREVNGKILLCCHADCSLEAICEAVGIKIRELFVNLVPSPQIEAVYAYTDEVGELLFEVVRYMPKGFRQRRPDGHGGVKWNLSNVRRVLYRLPEVLLAASVLVVEGEKDCETARELGMVATCNAGGAGKWREDYAECLGGKRLCIITDADEAGRKHAQEVARSLHHKAASLKVLELPGAKDLSEWVEGGGTKDALLKLVRDAPEWAPPQSDGVELLDQVVVFVRRFLSLSEFQAVALAIWVVHTHSFSSADCTPYLAVTSAEKESGKTRLLEVLKTLVAKPWFTGRVTAAVLVRKIDKLKPTLLLDEGDAAFGSEKEYAEALRGVLNTGYRRDGSASCCVGQGANISFQDFSTFCPKVIAGICDLPDTVASRSIPIRLKRAKRGESIERFRSHQETEAAPLREKIQTWAALNLEKLRNSRPELPESLTDRQQDVAEPLLAIADAAGGHWPITARRALMDLCGQAHADNQSTGEQLLADIKQVFDSLGVDRISSSELATALAGIETSPWGEWGKSGKPISAAKLARLLGRFGITPQTIRIEDKTLRGYMSEDFIDAFERHLRVPPSPHSGEQSATTQHADGNVPEGLRLEAHPNNPSKRNTCTGSAPEIDKKPRNDGPCGVVALSPVSADTEEDEVII